MYVSPFTRTLTVATEPVAGGFDNAILNVTEASSSVTSDVEILTVVTSSGVGLSGDVSSKIVVTTVSLPIVRLSYPPPVVPMIFTL